MCLRSIDKPFGSLQMSSASGMIRLGQNEKRLGYFEKCLGSGSKNLGRQPKRLDLGPKTFNRGPIRLGSPTQTHLKKT
jgi:hypothetical protein